MDSLFRERDRDHILRFPFRLRSGSSGRRRNEQNARKLEAVRIDLQQQMVFGHQYNFISQQNRYFQGENQVQSVENMFSGLPGRQHIRGNLSIHSRAVPKFEQEEGE